MKFIIYFLLMQSIHNVCLIDWKVQFNNDE